MKRLGVKMSNLGEVESQLGSRSEERRRTNLRVWVDPGGALPGVDCELVDISNWGARLRLPQDTALPDTFVVHVDTAGNVREAVVVWRNGRDVGVKFGAPKPRRLHGDLERPRPQSTTALLISRRRSR